ncbi:hypothetical protein MSG28_003519 [Choristoneura fumiferana]|uniref:Uncharacterized protein n=1 Tax=Choristoneura fumiferana TaxID=7141 RepID=A0ACC0KFT6_CHOFU|nr:hypothetical protein MSG28_003519 [Choristoneura fumiferana]
MKVEDSFIVEKMASTTITEHKYSFENLKDYPPVINGRINALKFLEATVELLRIVESLGKLFAPVRYDMEGNITKIKKLHVTDKSCLLELMLDECSKGKPVATEGLLWLNRALGEAYVQQWMPFG